MKKFICLVLSVFLILSCVCISTMAAEDIRVVINGKEQNYDVMPVIVDGRTLVPMRAIFESLGAKVGWIDHSKTVTGTRNNKTIKLKIDDYMAYINGQETILDVPATIINGRTMVPVRFISEMLGERVEWDGTTKTVKIESDFVKNVAISHKLAPLTNNIHRDIPREFSSSSSFDDIIYYPTKSLDEVMQNAVIIADTNSLYSALPQLADKESCVVEKINDNSEDIVRYTIKNDLTATSKCIYNLKKLDNFNEGDTLLVSFDIRVPESSNNKHFAQIQLQESKSGKFNKILWEYLFITNEWQRFYFPITAQADYTDMGFRPGMYKGVVEVKNFSVVNLKDSCTMGELRHLKYGDYYQKDAQWRKDALDRIEKYKKGDFKVIVKDANGNVIPDANVEFDMFESEYLFGTVISGIDWSKNLRTNFGKYFNTGVHEGSLKWGPYVENPESSRKTLNFAKEAGVKHFRGHALVWERAIGSNGKSYLVPPFVLNEDNTVINDKAKLQDYINEWIYNVCDDFAGEIDEWDVVNEIAEKFLFRGVHGDDMMIDWFKWANEATPESLMVYNDFAHMYEDCDGDLYENLLKYAQYFKDNNVDIDALGFQSHMEIYTNKNKFRLMTPEEHYQVFKTFEDMGYKTSVTEYSMDNKDEQYQAEYTRDYFLLAYSMPKNYGFTMWGFWDGCAFAEYTPMFDKEWRLKPAGEQLIDLMYNKFWTRDVKAITNKDGEASIRGFYGDYDVTVNANGKTKTVSCAYHQGYDNVLEIVID